MSHDWPQGIEHHGDLQGLLRRKPFFQEDINKGKLGSPPLTELLKKLRPKRWFAAHLHVKFEAKFLHDTGTGAVSQTNPDEIAIDDGDFDVPDSPIGASPTKDSTAPEETLFLALDKCLPRRQYLEVIDVAPGAGNVSSAGGLTDERSDTPPQTAESSDVTADSSRNPGDQGSTEPDLASYSLPTSFGKLTKSQSHPHSEAADPQPRTMPELAYDLEWLAICRAFHPFLGLQHTEIQLPPETKMTKLIDEAREWVEHHVGQRKKIADVQTFVMTAPGVSGAGRQSKQVPRKFAELPLKASLTRVH